MSAFEFHARPPLPRVTAKNLGELAAMLNDTPPRGAKILGEGGARRRLRIVCENRVVYFGVTAHALRTLRHYGVTP